MRRPLANAIARIEAAALTWGDVELRPDGSGRASRAAAPSLATTAARRLHPVLAALGTNRL